MILYFYHVHIIIQFPITQLKRKCIRIYSVIVQFSERVNMSSKYSLFAISPAYGIILSVPTRTSLFVVQVNLIRYYRQPQQTLSYDIEDSRWRKKEEKTETCSHPRTHCCESETSWDRGLYDQCYKSIDGASVSPLIVFTQHAKAEQNSTGIVALINPRRGTKRGHSIYKINNRNAIEIQQKE